MAPRAGTRGWHYPQAGRCGLRRQPNEPYDFVLHRRRRGASAVGGGKFGPLLEAVPDAVAEFLGKPRRNGKLLQAGG